jgi:hypothetical protein
MKQRSLWLGLMLLNGNMLANITSRTIFNLPAPYRPGSMEEIAAKRNQLIYLDQDLQQQLTVTPFGSISTSGSDLAQYFLPCQPHGSGSSLIAGEFGSAATVSNSADLIANYFGVLTAPFPANGDPFDRADYKFQSKLKFKPKTSTWGAAISYRHHLSDYVDKGFWVEVVAPIVRVKTKLGLCEEVQVAGGTTGANPNTPAGYFSNMLSAFKQSDWNYGKISGAQTKAGLADIYLKLGYIYAQEEHYYLNTYFGAVVPTSAKPTNEFLFEPTMGNNGHFGILSGASVGVRLWADCEKSLYWILDTAGTMLLPTSQLRTMDLQGRPWSRYLWVYLSSSNHTVNPGVNSFTLPVQVEIGSIRDLNTAWVYKTGDLHLEAGYHFFHRGPEELSLQQSLGSGVAVAGIVDQNGDYDNAVGISRNQASIKRYLTVSNEKDLVGNDTYVPLSSTDLDLNSAAHPAMTSHAFYVAAGHHWLDFTTPVYLGVGTAVEWGVDNAALSRLAFWGKVEISF